nr:TonB-dependent receptor plug domain-containing protein [uncultured Ottowia sp.]
MRAQAPCIWRRGGAAPFLVSACAAACLLLAGAPAGGAESGAYHRPDRNPDSSPDGALASGGHAASESALPEVVITSSKRAQPLARFNGGAAVASEQALRDAGAGGTLALDKALPGLYTGYGANVMFPIFTVRGMTSAQDFYNPALTVYVDGVPQLPVMAAQSLAGAARVELLKGPQGTLYGQSALGGVLNVSTRTPGDAPYFSLLAGLSSRGGHVAQAEAAGPLSPGLLYGSAMVSKRSAPGDVSSAALAQSRLGGARDGLGRFRLRLAPQGQPWEASAWAARECTSGPQDVYVPFADIRPRQAYADARVAAPWRFFHMRRCANSVAAQGQRDWGSPGNG